MSWQVNGVSVEPEEVYAEVIHSMPKPVGIIVFGADSALKAKTFHRFGDKVGRSVYFSIENIHHLEYIGATIGRGRSIVACIRGDDSMHHVLRRQIARQMRASGARKIIGVYAEATKLDKIDFSVIATEHSFNHQAYYRQIDKLSQDPPTGDDFDFYIIITSDPDDHTPE